MNWKKILTPSDTEEIKPGLFIQTRYRNIDDGQGNVIGREALGYRQIEPLVWEGKFRKKEQLRSIFSWRTLITISIILFIAWSYLHDTGAYREFYNSYAQNPIAFCENVLSGLTDDKMGLEVNNVSTYTYPLQDYT